MESEFRTYSYWVRIVLSVDICTFNLTKFSSLLSFSFKNRKILFMYMYRSLLSFSFMYRNMYNLYRLHGGCVVDGIIFQESRPL